MLKGSIIALLLLTLYLQLFRRDNLPELWAIFKSELSTDRLPLLFLVVLLMPLNWALETLKWYQLIRPFSKIPFFKAFAAVLSGVTVSLVTPNRIGEYGGRVLLIEPENNWRAVIATLVGSWSQLLVLLTAGIIGLLYFATTYMDWAIHLQKQLLIPGMILVLLLLFFYLNVGLCVPVLSRLPLLKRQDWLIRNIRMLETYSRKLLLITLSIAFFRYLIYSIQYFLILQFFGIQIDFWAAFSGIASIFLIQTSVPLPPLLGLLARGDIALYIWGYFHVNDISILAATFTLFIINLCIPALLGLTFIVKINVLKSLGYEKKEL